MGPALKGTRWGMDTYYVRGQPLTPLPRHPCTAPETDRLSGRANFYQRRRQAVGLVRPPRSKQGYSIANTGLNEHLAPRAGQDTGGSPERRTLTDFLLPAHTEESMEGLPSQYLYASTARTVDAYQLEPLAVCSPSAFRRSAIARSVIPLARSSRTIASNSGATTPAL
jgi:hypothetical protein